MLSPSFDNNTKIGGLERVTELLRVWLRGA